MMIDPDKSWSGASSVSVSGSGSNILETPNLKVTVNTNTLKITYTDKLNSPQRTLASLSKANRGSAWKGFDITPESTKHVYGLGQQFDSGNLGNTDGDWISGSTSHHRVPLDSNGNMMQSYNGGAVGDTLFPVFYSINKYSTYYHGYCYQ